jgi:hypothetical protein
MPACTAAYTHWSPGRNPSQPSLDALVSMCRVYHHQLARQAYSVGFVPLGWPRSSTIDHGLRTRIGRSIVVRDRCSDNVRHCSATWGRGVAHAKTPRRQGAKEGLRCKFDRGRHLIDHEPSPAPITPGLFAIFEFYAATWFFCRAEAAGYGSLHGAAQGLPRRGTGDEDIPSPIWQAGAVHLREIRHARLFKAADSCVGEFTRVTCPSRKTRGDQVSWG